MVIMTMNISMTITSNSCIVDQILKSLILNGTQALSLDNTNMFTKAAILLLAICVVANCSTTSRQLSSSYNNYYLDNSFQCTTFGYNTEYLSFFNDIAYVHAWTSSYSKNPLGSSCSLSIASTGAYGMRFKFLSSSDFIGSGSARLNIYSGQTTYGTTLASYSYPDNLPTTYQHTHDEYITVELVNYGKSVNFDFTLVVTNYDDLYSTNVGEIVGITVGCFVFVVLVVILSVVRGRRYYRRRRNVIIATSGTAYPTGTAPYPTNYGSVTTVNYPPPPLLITPSSIRQLSTTTKLPWRPSCSSNL
ncbi:hypothetical protein EB796_000220 [Bugula neritina]|uniref:CUB domain-containing protein n=1 Tax=Bugula neritina TaxID=10212 RepID=A0A7J7KTH0_BUGNE|nr:hypothetical protein EB796_000220 [Bugula neritina]